MPRKSQKSEPQLQTLDEQTKPDDSQKKEAELLRVISRCSTVINGLENHEPFKMLLEDCRQTITVCDSTWHTVAAGDTKVLEELRISKMAADHIVNILDKYKFDLLRAQKDLTDLVGYDKIIPKYYDLE